MTAPATEQAASDRQAGDTAAERARRACERIMWAALIDIRRGHPGAAKRLLLAHLRAFEAEPWDGTETGAQWLRRTSREAETRE